MTNVILHSNMNECDKNYTLNLFSHCLLGHKTILQTRNTSSQCYKGNGIDRVLEEDEAAQVTCHVTNHSCTDTNHGNGDDETWVAIGQSWILWCMY